MQMVFSFFMINAIFVVTLFLMQTNGEALSIPMPWGEKFNITYATEGTSLDIDATVTIDVTYMMLEPIGTMLIVLFGGIMIIQGRNSIDRHFELWAQNWAWVQNWAKL